MSLVLFFHIFFSQDFIRAAMTCINFFYQEGANSYLDLYTRIGNLHTALRHMQSYLDPSEWGSVRRSGSMNQESKFSSSGQSADPVRLTQSPEDVSRLRKKFTFWNIDFLSGSFIFFFFMSSEWLWWLL